MLDVAAVSIDPCQDEAEEKARTNRGRKIHKLSLLNLISGNLILKIY